jgi:hypothetical protein
MISSIIGSSRGVLVLVVALVGFLGLGACVQRRAPPVDKLTKVSVSEVGVAEPVMVFRMGTAAWPRRCGDGLKAGDKHAAHHIVAALPAVLEVTASDYNGIERIAVASDGRWSLSHFTAEGASMYARDGRVTAEFTTKRSRRTLRFRVSPEPSSADPIGPTLSIDATDFGFGLKKGKARVRVLLVTGEACA